MGSHEGRNLAPYDFTQSVHDDIATFMNLHEFAAMHEIDGHKVPCIVTSRYQKSTQYDGVYTQSNVLLIQACYVKKASPGTTLKLNGVTYQIQDSKLLQGELWRIELGVCDI